jgi:dTDP-4-amino-4,6-dideoxygalactose transaminase
VAPEQFIPFALPDIGEDEIDTVVEAMRSGWLTTGPRVAAFELEFAEQIGGGVGAVVVDARDLNSGGYYEPQFQTLADSVS